MPKILALDFDGVICDGLIEYFQTTCRTYCQIWSTENFTMLDSLAERFYPLRPVIETGWEMPILLRALVQDISDQDILKDWSTIAQQIVTSEQLNKKNVSQKLDGVRDHWIREDLAGWLGLHRFYPGVIDKIGQILNSSTELYIVTTKEGRFVKQLLQQQGIKISPDRVIGKECQRPKYETLRQLRDQYYQQIQPENQKVSVWFIEDRLKTLQLVQQQPDLQTVQLFLADWGYNTVQMRASISQNPNITLLSLGQFTQDFDHWSHPKS